MQPHWLLELHVHAVLVPQSVVDPAVQVFVQKCVCGSPRSEHSGAAWVDEQSDSDAQNFPMPSSLPVSPGWPHFEKYASGPGASGFFALELELHALNGVMNAIQIRRPMTLIASEAVLPWSLIARQL